MTDKPKIFVFVNCVNSMGYNGLAMAEDGTVLAGHCSSSPAWLVHDMGLVGDWKHKKYAAYYPDGYELVDVIGEPGTVEAHAECLAAIALGNAKDAAVVSEAPTP